ncbi:MAG: DUF58 domain-containing protein [archaeon]
MATTQRKLNINAAPMIKKLEVMVRLRLQSGLLGAYISIFKGVSGLEFDGYRTYTQDDDAGRIDWKASKRTRQLLVKEFVETRELEVFFLIDVSRSMVFGSTEKLKNEYAAELALCLAYIIQLNGDKVGYALFNNDIAVSRQPAKGTLQYSRLFGELNNPDSYGGGYNLTKALEFVNEFIERKGTMLIIISDFLGLDKTWVNKLKLISHKFDVISIMIRDPRDEVLSKEVKQVLIEDPYSSRKMLIDSELLSNFYEAIVSKDEKELQKTFTDLNVDFLKLRTDKEFINPIIQLFSKRRTIWK